MESEMIKLDDLLGYLEENWDGIYGSRNLKSKVGAKEVLVVGSGSVEKNIDLILCRRFKGRGMSWSRARAQNLLKLRLLRYDRRDWKAYWPAEGELKCISVMPDARQKTLCPKWAEILLREKTAP